MVFSSVLFLFYFLPLVLLCYFILGRSNTIRNLILLGFSLSFYAWGEGHYTLILLISILANYLFGRFIASHKNSQNTWLFISVIFNLGMLGFFKYANFLVDNLNLVLLSLGRETILIAPIHLPIGISFFTFQALSYVVDVYRGKTNVQTNILNLGLYIALFPQLIAGPIVRYTDIAHQLLGRILKRENIALGVQRFAIGLAKKVMIADQMSLIVDSIFAQSPSDLSTPVAWLGIITYVLQILFDFSGYSDMAIGLGRVFGFTFLENFNYPYIAQSVRDFWRRWHISLSTWFRDYAYIPLGGNRQGVGRTYLNLYIVFFLTGLWHGASWNFVIWGLWHGTFLVIERLGFDSLLNRIWQPLRHIYLLLVVLVGWVIFRVETMPQALAYIRQMFIWSSGNGNFTIPIIMNDKLWLLMLLGFILSTPVFQFVYRYLRKRWLIEQNPYLENVWLPFAGFVVTVLLMLISIITLVGSVNSPFIYFRF